MKKYITSLVVAFFALTAVALSQTVAVTGTFEGEHVFRGQATGKNVGGTELTINLPSKTELTVLGLWDVDTLKTNVREVDVSLAQGFAIDKATTFKVGGIGYFYPKASPTKGETNYTLELFGSLVYDTFLNPTVTAGYDLNLQQLFAEGTLSQPIELFFLAKGFKIVPSVALGWSAAKDSLPEKRGPAVKDSYYYATGQVDFVYEVKNVVVGAGYRRNYLNNSITVNNDWVGGFLTVRF